MLKFDDFLADPQGVRLIPFRPKLSAYFPPGKKGYATPQEARQEGGPVDVHERPLRTLQEFIEGRALYVSVAADLRVLKYGTILSIPHLDAAYNEGQPILFIVVDTGSAFTGRGMERLDICVEGKGASLMGNVNMWAPATALVGVLE